MCPASRSRVGHHNLHGQLAFFLDHPRRLAPSLACSQRLGPVGTFTRCWFTEAGRSTRNAFIGSGSLGPGFRFFCCRTGRCSLRSPQAVLRLAPPRRRGSRTMTVISSTIRTASGRRLKRLTLELSCIAAGTTTPWRGRPRSSRNPRWAKRLPRLSAPQVKSFGQDRERIVEPIHNQQPWTGLPFQSVSANWPHALSSLRSMMWIIAM
jgi:hypothetical protein